jgi:formyltetrahydrofolate-dependent phosphoribosylglycinamide formyltransferase
VNGFVPAGVRPPLQVAVFASGSGSNLQALLDHSSASASSPPLWRPVLVVADRPGIRALDRAEAAGVPSVVVPVTGQDPESVARALLDRLAEAGVELVVLAGYLRLLHPLVVQAFRGRMLNLHPSLLPAFGGKGMYGIHIHRAVLEHGVRVTGVTVHLVDEHYDQGKILAQWPVPVLSGDDPETLAARVLEAEHALYPRVVDHLARALLEGAAPTPLNPDSPVFLPGPPSSSTSEDP